MQRMTLSADENSSVGNASSRYKSVTTRNLVCARLSDDCQQLQLVLVISTLKGLPMSEAQRGHVLYAHFGVD